MQFYSPRGSLLTGLYSFTRQNKAKPAAKANGAAKATPKKGKKGAAEKGNGKGSAVKVAQVVGTAKAKRAALQAQKRGLNATGKASKMDIDRAVKSEKAKGVSTAWCHVYLLCCAHGPVPSLPSEQEASAQEERRPQGGQAHRPQDIVLHC